MQDTSYLKSMLERAIHLCISTWDNIFDNICFFIKSVNSNHCLHICTTNLNKTTLKRFTTNSINESISTELSWKTSWNYTYSWEKVSKVVCCRRLIHAVVNKESLHGVYNASKHLEWQVKLFGQLHIDWKWLHVDIWFWSLSTECRTFLGLV